MQDRPKRLKVEIFPYDDLDMNMLLWDLNRTRFVIRYQAESHPYIWIPTWGQHQHPRPDEGESTYPAFQPGMERAGGPEATTFPAVRPIETDPSLSSHGAVTAARMGDGTLDLGSGNLDMGEAAAPPSPPATHIRAQDLIDLWNATTKPPIPRCRELTDERRRKIRIRVAKRPSIGEWRQVFEAIQGNPFYQGENDRQWTADFDWVIKNDTVSAKVLERIHTMRVVPKSEAPRYQPWECPHQPKCLQRHHCHLKSQIEQAS